ncbi:P-loop containing nucleoside triphosphate hydrolase protein [Gigaspora rosea]|uniref:(d)CMP kinase n=1 Tax=Gigaspora rosea TaxID=44941 RepID=A0A397U7F3_9GLOM|nr:P-loop containing nucleoside triphosphate hydrolase protein [Gigaspora rosea]
MKINIAIDGPASSGKTTIGKKLSEKLEYQLIDSGVFYRYFAKKFYLDNIIQINEIYLFKDEMLNNPFYHLKEIEHVNTQFYQDLTISQRASEIAKVPEIRSIINEIIQIITKKKGFVVLGRDATTKILPDAKIKLILDVEREAKIQQSSQLNNLTELEIIGKVLSDILKRDFDAYELILEAKKVATIINTSNLSIEQVLAKIFRHVYWYNFKESSSKSNIEPTVEELIEYKNWPITNYVSDKAFIHIFSNLEKRYEFISNLLEFNQKCLENYEHIERDVLPRNRQDDLFRDAQVWRKNVLNGPKCSARFQISRLEELLKDLEYEIDEFYEKNQEKNFEQKNNNK